MTELSIAIAYLGTLAFAAFLLHRKAPSTDAVDGLDARMAQAEKRIAVLSLKAGLKD